MKEVNYMKAHVALAVLAILMLSGCAGNRVYLNDEADFGFYEKAGVVPFSNLTSDRTAAEKVTATFTTELLMINVIDVTNAGDFLQSASKVITSERANIPEELTAEEAKAIGQTAGVQGIFVGVVRDFAMIRSGQEEFPLVSILVRFVDCQTGKIVWSFETTRRGGPKFPVFSFGETHTLGDLNAKVCRDIVAAFRTAVK
jgi:PBP1b-binding outer membrane lipoprotein LpoB